MHPTPQREKPPTLQAGGVQKTWWTMLLPLIVRGFYKASSFFPVQQKDAPRSDVCHNLVFLCDALTKLILLIWEQNQQATSPQIDVGNCNFLIANSFC